jgi:hypothetical protein
MKTLKFNSLVLFIVIITFYSCGSDPEPEPIPQSSEKSITGFKFSGITPEVVGIISESDKKISLIVSAQTDITALVPTISISEKSTVSPQSGVIQNFSNPVTYTVRAEDGTTQAYQVTVEFQKSAAKSITAFKFSGLAQEVSATIDEESKKISATVPNGANVTALAPTISLSEKATVSPASGTATDFTSPVTYTVTAEDGSTAAYKVTVTIDPTVSFTIDPYTNGLKIEQGGALILRGEGFGDASNNKIVLTDINNSASTFEIPASLLSQDELMLFSLPYTLPIGDYKIRVFVDGQAILMDEVFTITYPSPVIGDVEPTTLVRGENITISGLHFGLQNRVTLSDDQDVFELEIISENSTTIVAKVPDDLSPSDYTLSVISNEKEARFDESITVQVPANTPYITEITDTSIARGETMIIRGGNLKKIGFATNINFLPWPNGGVTQVRSAIANDEGTEITFVIPNDFPTGTYTIEVEVDFEYSDEYDEVIQIN